MFFGSICGFSDTKLGKLIQKYFNAAFLAGSPKMVFGRVFKNGLLKRLTESFW